ncbi:MAG: protein kinase family protein [Chlamydiia bacterium]|nr:protein kinase family protein [Chlamydiia bacterium]
MAIETRPQLVAINHSGSSEYASVDSDFSSMDEHPRLVPTNLLNTQNSPERPPLKATLLNEVSIEDRDLTSAGLSSAQSSSERPRLIVESGRPPLRTLTPQSRPSFITQQQQAFNEQFKDNGLTVSNNSLGSGSFGGVYQGMLNGEDVAVKILVGGEPFHLTQGEGLSLLLDKKNGFHRSSAILIYDSYTKRYHYLERNHPRLSAFDGAEGIYVVGTVSKLRSGGSLNKRLHTLESQAAVGLCQELIQTVDNAHKQGISHGDIAERNILLTPKKEPSSPTQEKLKLADWGCARYSPQGQRNDWEQTRRIISDMGKENVIKDPVETEKLIREVEQRMPTS